MRKICLIYLSGVFTARSTNSNQEIRTKKKKVKTEKTGFVAGVTSVIFAGKTIKGSQMVLITSSATVFFKFYLWSSLYWISWLIYTFNISGFNRRELSLHHLMNKILTYSSNSFRCTFSRNIFIFSTSFFFNAR